MGEESKSPLNTRVNRASRVLVLGMTTPELTAILDRVDADSAPKSQRRQSRRLTYRRIGVPMVVRNEGGNGAPVLVVTRNLSRGGMAFLHGAFMHARTPIVLMLRHSTKGDVPVAAEVVRCRHIERHIHEIGVRFTTPIDIRDFVEIDLIGAQYSLEVADPGMLRGKLLVVADYEIDRALITHYLEPTAIELTCAASTMEALKAAVSRGADLVLTDYDLGIGTGIDVVEAIRAEGLSAPVIMMSADLSSEVRAQVREAKIEAFLPKPIPRDMFYSALAEFFLLGSQNASAGGVVSTSLPENSPLLPLAVKFADELRELAPKLEALLAAGKLEEFVKQTTRVGATAMALEFHPIAKLAQQAIHAINSSGSIDESIGDASAFTQACRRVKSVAA